MNAVQQETYYGIIPIKLNERLYDFKSMFIVAAGYSIASWCYVQGTWVSSVLPFYFGQIATLMGIMLFAVPTFLATIVCCRFGCDIWIYQRALYGNTLNMIILVPAAAMSGGWGAVNARVFAGSTLLVGNAAGMNWGEGAIPWLGSACVLCGFVIAYNGPIAVKKFSFLAVPILIFVGLLTVFLVFSKISPSELNNAAPLYASAYNSLREGLMYVMESNFAYSLSWFVVMGILPRLTKSEPGSTWGIYLGMGLALCFFVGIGILTGAYMGAFGLYSEDPTEAFLRIGGPILGLLSVIFVAFANVGTTAIGLYGLSIVIKILKPNWTYKWICIFWTVVILVFTFSGIIWDYYAAFVSLGGCIYAPAISLLLVDFFIIRKQRFSLKSAYLREHSYDYHAGFNLVALTSLLVGIAVYFALFDPISYVARSQIFFITTATGGAFLASGLVYWLLSLIPALSKYLLKDQEELDERLGKDYIQR